MTDINHFANMHVHITHILRANCKGHFPYKLFVEKSSGQKVLHTIKFKGITKKYYVEFIKQFRKDDPKRVYMSLDFPPSGDIEQDFIVIFSYENNKLSGFAIPYSAKDGTKSAPIYKSETLDKILLALDTYILRILEYKKSKNL